MKHARKDYNRIQDPENKIPADEPVFIVRAQDPLAADVMRYWAAKHRQAMATRHNISVHVIDDTMADIVEAHADLADAWPVKKSIADM